MAHTVETLHTRLAHVEERLARLEKTEAAWRDTESRLRVLETEAAETRLSLHEEPPTIERLEEQPKPKRGK